MFGLIPFKTNSVKNEGGVFNNFLTDFFNDDFFSPMNISNVGSFNADIKETSNEYILDAELPGVKKEDINLEYRDNNLIISAKRDEIINEEKDNYIRRERSYGQFSRSFYVGNVDRNEISAKFENGELHVVLPKMNKVIDNTNRIEIQ